MYIISNYLSIIIVIGIIDNLAADYPTQFFLMLYLAALVGRLEAVQVLLEYNANINSQDSTGETPLFGVFVHNLNYDNSKAVIRRLLEHGADPDICNMYHRTPLREALSRGWLEAARLLLNYGAKVNEKDKEDKTPLQMAASKGHKELTKLLLEHGAVAQQ